MSDAELIAELIARLRELSSFENGVGVMQDFYCGEEMLAAAARIEALIAERDYTEGTNDTLIALNQALEAKLAKAVEELEDIVKDCEADYPPPHEDIKYFARATLAEIKGESHE